MTSGEDTKLDVEVVELWEGLDMRSVGCLETIVARRSTGRTIGSGEGVLCSNVSCRDGVVA